jgi:hypothetical protein
MTERAFDRAVGSFVYPRLPRARGLAIIEETRSWALDKLAASSATDHPDAAPIATGARVAPRILEELRDGVRSVARDRGYPEMLRRGREWTFDSAAGRVLYQKMDIIPADAAAEGVWSFLSLVLLPEIGPWRFPERAQDRLLGHPRNIFRRSWWRAHVLGEDLDAAPDGQQPLGEDELVQIMERPTLAANPQVARAVRDGIFRGAHRVDVARSEFARDLTKRMLRLTPFITFDLLDEIQLTGLVDDLIEQSASAFQR